MRSPRDVTDPAADCSRECDRRPSRIGDIDASACYRREINAPCAGAWPCRQRQLPGSPRLANAHALGLVGVVCGSHRLRSRPTLAESGDGEIRNIVILTGAGISAESGLATFRGPDGLWEGHRVEDVATPEAFARDPALVQRFYDARRAQAGRGRAQCGAPGAGAARRRMAGRAADRHPECRRPARAGRARSGCSTCTASSNPPGASPATRGCPGTDDLGDGPACPDCGAAGRLRPDIVWFGEMPYEMERIDRALMDADLFVSIGTSGAVYPAAGFVQTARYSARGRSR